MKRWVKILIYCFSGMFLALGIAFGYFYHQYEGRYNVNAQKYPQYIGHLSTTEGNHEFERCDENRLLGWYASAATYVPIYEGSKSTFRTYIQSNFSRTASTDNGFLSLRFIINCKGDVGAMEIQELDHNYQETRLAPNLVEQLVSLSSRTENWSVPDIDGVAVDSYMYLIYKIEDGEIVEILP